MELTIYQTDTAKEAGKVTVNEQVFGRDYNQSLVHQAVVAYMATGRVAPRVKRNRANVRGGGIKPWRQKGTGRARAGSIRSPIWRGGGVTFGGQVPNFKQKINKKMYQGAMRAIFSELARLERLTIVDSLELSAPKTKELQQKLQGLKIDNAVIISDKVEENLYLAARNLKHVTVIDVSAIQPVVLLKYEHVVISRDAVTRIEEQLS